MLCSFVLSSFSPDTCICYNVTSFILLWLDIAFQIYSQNVGDFLALFPPYLRQVYLSIPALV